MVYMKEPHKLEGTWDAVDAELRALVCSSPVIEEEAKVQVT